MEGKSLLVVGDMKSLDSPGSVLPSPEGQSPGMCRAATEISCCTDIEFDVARFNWRVSNFPRMRKMAKCHGLPPDGDVITSPVYIDVAGGQWWLRLYPYENRNESVGQVAVFVHTDRPTYGATFFSFRMVLLDEDDNEVLGSAGGVKFHKFEKGDGVRNFGFFDFLKDEEAVKVALVNHHCLHIFCEINIFSSPTTSLQDAKSPTPNFASLVASAKRSRNSFV